MASPRSLERTPLMALQTTFSVGPFKRGFHLITSEVNAALRTIEGCPETGIAHLFLQHTSAALSLNENADPTVRSDFEAHFNVMVPENQPYYQHTYEGPDDMPAHIKSSLLGAQLSIPISRGTLNLGTWQGVYLCEHRDHASRRRLVLTVLG